MKIVGIGIDNDLLKKTDHISIEHNGEKMGIVGTGNDNDLFKKTDCISIEHNGEKYTITPEKDGLRIHKHGLCSYMNYILVRPCKANEIVFR